MNRVIIEHIDRFSCLILSLFFGIDCGAFVMAFTKYFSVNKIDFINEDFDMELYHQHVACLLCHYGRMKSINNIENGDEEMVVQKKKAKGKKSERMSKKKKTIHS